MTTTAELTKAFEAVPPSVPSTLRRLANLTENGLPTPWLIMADLGQVNFKVRDLADLPAILASLEDGFTVTRADGRFPVALTGRMAGVDAKVEVHETVAVTDAAPQQKPLAPALSALLGQAVYA